MTMNIVGMFGFFLKTQLFNRNQGRISLKNHFYTSQGSECGNNL